MSTISDMDIRFYCMCDRKEWDLLVEGKFKNNSKTCMIASSKSWMNKLSMKVWGSRLGNAMTRKSLVWSERNTENHHRNWEMKSGMWIKSETIWQSIKSNSHSKQMYKAVHWIVQYEQFTVCYAPLSWLNPMKRRSFSPDAVELLEAWPSRDMFIIVPFVWPYSCR